MNEELELLIVYNHDKSVRCIYLDDHRISGGKPYVSEYLPQVSLKVKTADIVGIASRHQSNPIDPDYNKHEVAMNGHGIPVCPECGTKIEACGDCADYAEFKAWKEGKKKSNQLRAKIGAVVFHAAGRALTPEENLQVCDMVLCPAQSVVNACSLDKCPYHKTRGTDSDGICHIHKGELK